MGVIVTLFFIIIFIVIINKLVRTFIDSKTSKNLVFLFKILGALLALFFLLIFWIVITYR